MKTGRCSSSCRCAYDVVLEQVEIRHVRNVTEASFDLSPHLNLFVGPNGAGKTALLEALHLLIRGRSFRTRDVSALIQRDAPSLSVFASCRDEARGRVRVGVARSRSNQTDLRLNGEAVRQSSAIAALLPVQLLLPNLADLVFGAPRERRQWLDWGTFHVKQGYLEALRGYVRCVRQRNALLRGGDRNTLGAWTERMVALGAQVAEARGEYFADAKPAVLAALTQLAPDIALSLDYRPGFQGRSRDDLAREVGESTARDVKSGITHVGPHRADVRLGAEGRDAANVLSRGQGKAAASALRLGQASALLERFAARSLFLIDDVWAELDGRHSERFFELLSGLGCQILATSTDRHDIATAFGAERVKVFHVKQGVVQGA